jgi:membrane protease YdiL (CAAX protease family)
MIVDTRERRGLWEAATVIATSAANFLAETVWHAKGPVVAAAAAGWLIYLLGRVRREPDLWRDWGFRTDNLGASLREASLAGAAALALIVPFAFWRGHFPPPPSFWAVAALYPLWGLAQQFLLNALLARNLRPFLGDRAVVLTAAAFFSLAHAPDWPLMGLTFAIGLPWVWLYLRRPNLWVLGLWHGLLGAAAWYGVLGRDALGALLP